MKLIFKQRLISWFDSYDIYDEDGNVVYTVKGELSWGHCLRIYDSCGEEVGMIKEKILTLLPKFEIFENGEFIGTIKKEFTIFRPSFNIDYLGWRVTGNFVQWDYHILDSTGNIIAVIAKELFRLRDTYIMNISNPDDALNVLMLVLAIDIEKCSNSSD